MLKTVLALLTVFAVMAVHGLFKLVTLPFRAVGVLFRYRAAPARLPAA